MKLLNYTTKEVLEGDIDPLLAKKAKESQEGDGRPVEAFKLDGTWVLFVYNRHDRKSLKPIMVWLKGSKSDARLKVQVNIRMTEEQRDVLDSLAEHWSLDRNEVVSRLVEHALSRGWKMPPN